MSSRKLFSFLFSEANHPSTPLTKHIMCVYRYILYSHMEFHASHNVMSANSIILAFLLTYVKYGEKTTPYIYLNGYNFQNCTFQLHQVIDPSCLFYTCFSVGKSVNPAISCQKLARIYIIHC